MNKIFMSISALALAVAGLSSCVDDYDEYDNSYMLDNDETMTLTASSSSIELKEETPADEPVLTFTWTDARPMPDDYTITYVTELDLAMNEFSTSERETHNEGDYTLSYTTEELQSLITEKWGQSRNVPSILSFRVIAKWDGGTKYAMPEVRTVDVEVRPYRPLIFDADDVYLEGEAVTGTSSQRISTTVENENIYAAYLNLNPGELEIRLELDDASQYIAPAEGYTADFKDGVAIPAQVISPEECEDEETAPVEAKWSIPEAGKYRVVIDMEGKTVTIYSPEHEINNTFFTISWYPNDNHELQEITTVLDDDTVIYMRGASAGWNKDGKAMQLTQSLADPMIFVYSGDAFNNRTDFALVNFSEEEFNDYPDKPTDGVNNSCVIGPALDPDAWDGDGQDKDGNGSIGNGAEVTLGAWSNNQFRVGAGTWYEDENGNRVEEGTEGAKKIDPKGSYWQVPSGTNYVTFAFREMKIKFVSR